jgi:endonuclease G, mitochondrial
MIKIFDGLWKWLVRVFSLPKVDKEKPSSKDSTKPTPQPKPTEPNESGGKKNPIPPVPDEPKPTGQKGYNPRFLGINLQMPTLTALAQPQPLNYLHFSIVMNAKRKMPYFTAVNIDAAKYNKLKSQIPSRKEIGADTWIIDPRVSKEEQLPKSFYSKNDFDLGHMVRREDALWGDTLEEALAANKDTFFLTNATPQHKDFNRNSERWKGLEDYALRNARQNDLRISVFTGCVFTEHDRMLDEVHIPAKFWKLIVMIKEDGTPSATAYVIQQDDLIHDITERGIFVYAQFKTYQVDLKTLEDETGLTFGLNAFDPLQKVDTRGLMGNEPVLIDTLENIVF